MFAACTPFRLLAKLVYCGALPRARPLWACQPNPGGAEETRTPDPLRAKEVLSQLSYGPPALARRLALRTRPGTVVGHGGLEPPTSVLSGPRSNQLS